MQHPLVEAPEAAQAYLRSVGDRLRVLRAQRGMTRRLLASRSGVSERYIAQLEAGAGNISILLMRRLAQALGTDIAQMVTERTEPPLDLVLLESTLARLPAEHLAQARHILTERFAAQSSLPRTERVALVGLRGAGKSTLGRFYAEQRAMRFVELDREIEHKAGMDIAAIFEVHGQAGYRRLERDVLQELIGQNQPMTLATGGSIVTEAATYETLLSHCLTVWIRATPADHMARVIAQGDLRPMSDNRRAMEDLHAILHSRAELYAKADLVLDTSGRSEAQSLIDLLNLVG